MWKASLKKIMENRGNSMKIVNLSLKGFIEW